MASYQYDVFLSYAIEDKIELASELCPKLEQLGLKVWYAGNELIVGESIHDIIMEGLSKSRFGVVLVTKTYFEKQWTLQELYTLMAREQDGQRVVIPVFHKITPEEVALYNKLLAEKWALTTSLGLDHVVDKIVERVKTKEKPNRKPTIKSRVGFIAGIFLLLSVSVGVYWENQKSSPYDAAFQTTIETRIKELKGDVEEELERLTDLENAQVIDKETAIQTGEYFNSLEVQYRNYYDFTTGFKNYQFQKNVQPAAGFDFDNSSPINNYGFEYPNIYLIERKLSNSFLSKKIIYFNTQPVSFEIEEIENQDSLVLVTVNYEQPLRLLTVHYEYSKNTSERKHTSFSLIGLQPTEVYIFQQSPKGWAFSTIK